MYFFFYFHAGSVQYKYHGSSVHLTIRSVAYYTFIVCLVECASWRCSPGCYTQCLSPA